MFIDHSALKYLVNKPVLGGRIFIWLLLFQEFDFEVIVKPGKLNTWLDHLSRIMNGEEPTNLEDNFMDTQLFSFQIADKYFTDIFQYLSTGTTPQEYNTTQKKNLVLWVADYQLIAWHLFNMGAYNILRRCVLEHEIPIILAESHEGIAGGHMQAKISCRRYCMRDYGGRLFRETQRTTSRDLMYVIGSVNWIDGKIFHWDHK